MRAVSGAMYSGVPNTTPCWVTRPSVASGSRTLATPKSRIFTKSNAFSRSVIVCSPDSSVIWRTSSRRPSRRVSITFSGLRSRWTIPFACAAPSAPAIWFTMVIARSRSRRRSRCRTRVERLALQVLHHEEDRAVVRLAEVGDVDDVGVVDEARRARLAQEALDRLLAAAVAVVEDLHRHLFADVDVLAAVDDAHAAAPDDLVQLVLADGGTGSGVGGDHLVQIRIAPRQALGEYSSG